jgi:peroxiredoxin
MVSKKYIAVFLYAVFLVTCFMVAYAFAAGKKVTEVPDAFLGKAKGIQVDSIAPDFTLPNADGQDRRLYAMLESGPVILTFYRGGWCPYCNDQLYALQQVLPEFEELGAQLVAVSPEKPESVEDTVLKDGLTFEVLSDEGNKISRLYDLLWTVPKAQRKEFSEWLKKSSGKTLAEFNGVNNYELPIPATFVIAQDGTVVYVFKDKDYKKRANPEDIITALEHIAEHSPTYNE